MGLEAAGAPHLLRRFLTHPDLLAVDPRIILVAEDEDVVRRMLTRVLDTAGYRVLEARNGEEALRMAIFAYPYLHLVITDVVMPELDGRALGQRLKDRCPSLPVLYISAYPTDDLFHRGAPTATAPFLQKPVSPELLLSTVQQLLAAAPVRGLTPSPLTSA